MDRDKIKSAVELFIDAIGEDKEREGLRETPERIADMCEEILSGIGKDPREELCVHFNENHEELVLVRDISFFQCASITCSLSLERQTLRTYPKKES